MAFTSTIDEIWVEGNKRKSRGTYTSAGGSTGGDIPTGLEVVESFHMTQLKNAVQANAAVVNETTPTTTPFPTSITIVTDADTVGIWEASGR